MSSNGGGAATDGDGAAGGACVDDASYADPDGDGCAAYADASTASAYCGASGGYEASCASCCACAAQPSCADALAGGGGGVGDDDDDDGGGGSDGRVDYGEVFTYLMGVEQRSSCESDVEHGGRGGIHQPVNVATSLARVVVGTALLSPRRFRACGLQREEHGGEQLGGALLAAAGVLCCAHYLFGLRLLRATEVALRGTYVCWFVGEWLRRVMRQPLLLRILAVAVIPGAQLGLVRFVYAELPVDFGALDEYTSGVQRWLWPLLLLLVVALFHAWGAHAHRGRVGLAWLLLAVACAAEGADDAMCDRLSLLGYTLGGRGVSQLCGAAGFGLLGLSLHSQNSNAVAVATAEGVPGRGDGRGGGGRGGGRGAPLSEGVDPRARRAASRSILLQGGGSSSRDEAPQPRPLPSPRHGHGHGSGGGFELEPAMERAVVEPRRPGSSTRGGGGMGKPGGSRGGSGKRAKLPPPPRGHVPMAVPVPVFDDQLDESETSMRI